MSPVETDLTELHLQRLKRDREGCRAFVECLDLVWAHPQAQCTRLIQEGCHPAVFDPSRHTNQLVLVQTWLAIPWRLTWSFKKKKKIHLSFCIKDKSSCMIHEQRATALFLTSRVSTNSESLGSQTSCSSVPYYKFPLKKSTVLADWLALPLLQTTSLLCWIARMQKIRWSSRSGWRFDRITGVSSFSYSTSDQMTIFLIAVIDGFTRRLCLTHTYICHVCL